MKKFWFEEEESKVSHRREIEILEKKPSELMKLSKEMLLSLSEEEMKKIQAHYKALKRNPTDVELETIAQTWSEHCKHKVFCGTIEYFEGTKKTKISNMFKETIKEATEKIAEKKKNFLVSVFSDNAGIVKFNKNHDIAMKVETHNHPSALDPYGGANTGIGGVIRDVLGVGLGAKPVANTDIFCFGPHDYDAKKLPASILHPKRIAKGVRSGVRDYGNRMGIPTVNGAILFDERYIGNPLVYCGTVGIIPKGLHKKAAMSGDLIVAVGGRTGRDGIHGATFASVELEESTPTSPVQIGNAIEEKKVLDLLLRARDRRLYNAVTDCGAGGFSSAVGEMGKDIGARVYLDRAPLKYKGLKPWEIWVSESQERMVIAVSKEKLPELKKMAEIEACELSVIGEFTNDKKLKISYNNEIIAEMDMEFLHAGLPKVVRKAVWKQPKNAEPKFAEPKALDDALLKLLGMPNIASKESTIRQYDHEVQGGSLLKPLVGKENDGPSDAAIVRPLLEANECAVIANGINPKYSDIDTYWMAASAIDEAVRNAIAAGANPEKIAILDNFSWGNPNDEQKLAELVRACNACRDIAIEYGTPFISGKDSLYNEYIYKGKNISIPGTLLISALGIMDDPSMRKSMDFKAAGNCVYVLGATYNELGGSHYYALNKAVGQNVPKVKAKEGLKNFKAIFNANKAKTIESIHDCSEGGIAIALAEMCFAGMLGAEIDTKKIPLGEKIERADYVLFSESNSRFIIEVSPKNKKNFEKRMRGCAYAEIGKVVAGKKLSITHNGKKVIDSDIDKLKKAWKETLKW